MESRKWGPLQAHLRQLQRNICARLEPQVVSKGAEFGEKLHPTFRLPKFKMATDCIESQGPLRAGSCPVSSHLAGSQSHCRVASIIGGRASRAWVTREDLQCHGWLYGSQRLPSVEEWPYLAGSTRRSNGKSADLGDAPGGTISTG